MSTSYEKMRERFVAVAGRQETRSRLEEAAKRAESTVAKLNRSRTPEPEALEQRVSK